MSDHRTPLKTYVRRRNQGRRFEQRRRRAAEAFWGDASELPPEVTELTLTDDPDAVARSLGTPPLTGQEAVAQHYLAAVYGRAVRIAGALAAAGGLIDPEELADRARPTEPPG